MTSVLLNYQWKKNKKKKERPFNEPVGAKNTHAKKDGMPPGR